MTTIEYILQRCDDVAECVKNYVSTSIEGMLTVLIIATIPLWIVPYVIFRIKR